MESKISIITATYNRASTLPRAIESVLSQSHKNFEYIIVDDGSTDNTRRVVQEYDDARIDYIQLDENKGANTARNIGIKKSSGDYISILDSDDWFLPERNEKVVKYIEKAGEECCGVCHQYYRVRDGSVRSIGGVDQEKIELSDLSHGNVIGGFSSTVFKKEVVNKIGLLDEDMVAAQDYEYYLRCAKEGYFCGIDEPLSNYTVENGSISSDINRKKKSNRQLMNRHGDILSNKRHARHYYNRFFIYSNNGQLGLARRSLLTSLSYHPFMPQSYYFLIFSLLGKKGTELGISIKEKLTNKVMAQI